MVTSDRALRPLLTVVVMLLFVSGACALAYQQLWLRLLSLVFGVSVYAAATTLATFFAGLALGSFFGGRLADRTARPLGWYGIAELLIGFMALATPLGFDLIEWVYTGVHEPLPDSVAALTVVRFLLAFAILIGPATLMGATLPLIVRAVLRRAGDLGPRLSLLYAVNTAGAVAGTIVVGSWLIGSIGIRLSFQLGAAANIAVGVVALVASRHWERAAAPAAAVPDVTVEHAPAPVLVAVSDATRRKVLWVFAVSGFATIALEIVWFRVLVLYFDATNYAFAAILATVLAGIAGGSLVLTPLMRRRWPWPAILAALELALAASALLSFWLLSRSFDLYTGDSNSWVYTVVACVVGLLPATLLMGAAFPIGASVWASGREGDVGRELGVFYSLNVFGGILGSVIAGFAMVPALGARTSLVLLSALLLGSGLVLLPPFPRRALAATGSIAAFVAVVAVAVPSPYSAPLANRFPGEDVLWREEGTQATVSVHRGALGRVMYIDGLHQANTTEELVRFHRLIGTLPAALHPRQARNALVVGLGGGATPGALAALGHVDVDVVELSKEVVDGARWFERENYSVVDHPRVDIRIDDGRNFLLLNDRRYDVITADLIRPGTAGAGKLWSIEYWRLVRRALADDGVALQWIGDLSPRGYRMIVRSFLEVFPHSTLWGHGQLLVATKEPIRLDRSEFERKLRDPQVREVFAAAGIGSFQDLVAQYYTHADELRRFAGDGPKLTDDRPRLEFFRPGGGRSVEFDREVLRTDVAAILSSAR